MQSKNAHAWRWGHELSLVMSLDTYLRRCEKPTDEDGATGSEDHEQSSSSDKTSTSSSSTPRAKRPRQGDCKRHWNSTWEDDFLVSYDKKRDVCTCLKCMATIETVKKYSLQRHCEKIHPEVLTWSSERRKLFIRQAKDKLKKMNDTLKSSLQPATLLNEATYKLGMTLVKHHKPISFAEPMVNWAASCDPDSRIFKNMAKSRQTISRRITDISKFIESETLSSLQGAPAWSLLMDESTDSADHAQAVLYVRYPDAAKKCVVTKFLTILRVEGSPTAENLYHILNTFIESRLIPKEKLVSFTSDGASVMQSLGKGVAGFLRRNYNPKLFVQHCIVHRQVLASKDGLSKLPNHVHSTVDEVMRFFRNSHVRKEKLPALIEASSDEHDHYNLVTYHKVRWLSLNECVQRLVDLLPEIVQFFEEESHSSRNSPAERRRLESIHERLVAAEFQLYLFFLQGQLPIIAGINTQLQKSNQDLFTTYQKIKCFMQTLLEPVLVQKDLGLTENNLRMDIDNIVYPGDELIRFREQAVTSGQLSMEQMHVVLCSMYEFVVSTGKALESRFPELSFVLSNLSFLNPANRKFSNSDISAVVAKYSNGRVSIVKVKSQYAFYKNDDTLDFLAMRCENKPDRFFSALAKIPEYGEFGALALDLLCMSPDTVECERAFSHMNLTKTKHSARITQENLQARLRVYMDDRTLEEFPFHDVKQSQ